MTTRRKQNKSPPTPKGASTLDFSRLVLENVRCFARAEVPLEAQVTIIIGQNGSGKTSIAEAIASLAPGDGEGLERFPLRQGASTGSMTLYDRGAEPLARWVEGTAQPERVRLPRGHHVFAYGQYRALRPPTRPRQATGPTLLGPEWEQALARALPTHLEDALRRPATRTLIDFDEYLFRDLSAYVALLEERGDQELVEQGAKRKAGFASYAPEVLPSDDKGKPEFPPVWRTDERVRRAIAGMSHGFCAYCQSPVSSNHPGTKGEDMPPGQVEHFRPKARFPAQAYAWDNYFLACMGCNGAKHDKWPAGGYVRPDEGKPGSRFVFAESGEIKAREGDEQAKCTIEDFGLTRYWLTQHRGNAIQSHLDFVKKLIGRPGIRLQDVVITRPVAFSEATNQNVRRAWGSGRRRKKPSR